MIGSVALGLFALTSIVAATDNNPISWGQLGLSGVIIFAFISGQFWPKPSVERLLRELDRKDAMIDGLLEVNENKVIPTLVEVNEYLRRKKEGSG